MKLDQEYESTLQHDHVYMNKNTLIPKDQSKDTIKEIDSSQDEEAMDA